MLKLKIDNITCNHCISLVTRAIKSLDNSATVDVDLRSRIVTVNSSLSQTDVLAELDEIGYSATPVKACCTLDMSCKSAMAD